MATPSVLTVPSMYGDGILYSGPSAYGSEIASQPVDLQTDFVNNLGGVIVDANTFTSSGGGLDGIRSKDSSFTLPVGTAFEIEIRGTTTSNGITLGNFGGGGNEYGSGFGVHRFVSLNNRLFIRQKDSAGTTTITHLSIRPLTQGSDFDFTRDTTGTRINEEGYIEDVPYNIVPQSNQFDTTWIKTNTTVTGGQSGYYNTLNAWKIDILSSFAQVEQAVSTSGVQTFSVYAKAGTLNFVRLRVDHSSFSGTYFDLQNGVIGSTVGTTNTSMENVGGGWYRCSISFVNNTTRVRIYPATANNDLTATSGNIFIQNSQLVKGDQPKNYLPTTDRLNLPRLNYPAYGGCPSLLLEPQRNNVITYSEDFTQSVWVLFGYASGDAPILTSNYATSPDGKQNATRLQFNLNGGTTVTDRSYIRYDSFASQTDYYYSCYVKSANGQEQKLLWQHGGDDSEFTVTNQWQRVELDRNGFAETFAGFSLRGGISTVESADVLIWGFQVERGSYPTSYMPTSGSIFTRNEDKAINAGLGTTDTFNSTEGVLYAEIAALAGDGTNRFLGISDGSLSNRVNIIYNASNNLTAQVQGAGGLTANGVNILLFNKVALKYKSGDNQLWVNGLKVDSNTSTSGSTVGLNVLDFQAGNGSFVFYGKVKGLAVYKTALTDTELANLTSYNNHDLFIPYRSRMQMISADQELQCTEHDITRFL